VSTYKITPINQAERSAHTALAQSLEIGAEIVGVIIVAKFSDGEFGIDRANMSTYDMAVCEKLVSEHCSDGFRARRSDT